MANDYYYYIDGHDLGIVLSGSSTTTDNYTPCDTVAQIRLHGFFRQSDLSADTDTPNLINSRYHIGIAYLVLAEVIPEKYGYYMKKYDDIVCSIRNNQNILSTRQFILYDY